MSGDAKKPDIMKKTPMPEQEAAVRNKNFDEVTLGYTNELAMQEATRCLNCKHRPCVAGCPVNVQIPDFIMLIKAGDFEGAYKKIKETNALPAVCGRVCPQENQCEKVCVRAIKGESVGIGRLERFAADYAASVGQEPPPAPQKRDGRVAVVGSGPAGLTCASELAQLGYDVTVFEAFHEPGGVLTYGIPEFRLPKEIVGREIQQLRELGVKIETNIIVGRSYTVDELKEDGFDAIFIGSGAGLPMFMNIPGENLNGVYSANEFLTRVNLMKAYRFPEYDTPVYVGNHVAVVGGGNVAMDAARCAKRLGAESVRIVYRRSMEELPAREEEWHHAMDEGILFTLLTNPVAIIGGEKGWVTGLEVVEMELGEPDASGRRRPVEKPDSKHVLPADMVIMALGQSPNPLIRTTTPGLDTQKWGGIVADEDGRTSIEGVFAGGDSVTGAATVILAMGAGKKAAAAMHEYLQQHDAAHTPRQQG